MLYGSNTVLRAPTSAANTNVLVKTAARLTTEEANAKIQVKKLPHLLKMAKIARTIVASVVQKETAYRINMILATFLYASKAFLPLSPSSLFSSATVLSFAPDTADATDCLRCSLKSQRPLLRCRSGARS